MTRKPDPLGKVFLIISAVGFLPLMLKSLEVIP